MLIPLFVSEEYLSAQFKKETGSTLTEYVNGKRIKHAVSLLNTTSLQIQAIAQYCGIPDVNYFTKTFKKYIGTTPKEYRDSIREKCLKQKIACGTFPQTIFYHIASCFFQASYLNFA